MAGSSIAREADNVFYTLAGLEIAVATTKVYYVSVARGLDVDKPRNLAKSVTVE